MSSQRRSDNSTRFIRDHLRDLLLPYSFSDSDRAVEYGPHGAHGHRLWYTQYRIRRSCYPRLLQSVRSCTTDILQSGVILRPACQWNCPSIYGTFTYSFSGNFILPWYITCHFRVTIRNSTTTVRRPLFVYYGWSLQHSNDLPATIFSFPQPLSSYSRLTSPLFVAPFSSSYILTLSYPDHHTYSNFWYWGCCSYDSLPGPIQIIFLKFSVAFNSLSSSWLVTRFMAIPPQLYFSSSGKNYLYLTDYNEFPFVRYAFCCLLITFSPTRNSCPFPSLISSVALDLFGSLLTWFTSGPLTYYSQFCGPVCSLFSCIGVFISS
jgi:hypothetical protein